jgi:hypothetical protein
MAARGVASVDTEPRKRKITGIQIHHSTHLGDAARGLVNGAAGLSIAAKATADPTIDQLHAEACELARKVSEARRRSAATLARYYLDDPEGFRRCREGLEPWPDETEAGFEGRCTCHDFCAIHDRGRDAEEGWVCNCNVKCPQHD